MEAVDKQGAGASRFGNFHNYYAFNRAQGKWRGTGRDGRAQTMPQGPEQTVSASTFFSFFFTVKWKSAQASSMREGFACPPASPSAPPPPLLRIESFLIWWAVSVSLTHGGLLVAFVGTAARAFALHSARVRRGGVGDALARRLPLTLPPSRPAERSRCFVPLLRGQLRILVDVIAIAIDIGVPVIVIVIVIVVVIVPFVLCSVLCGLLCGVLRGVRLLLGA
jgi:hypothetical protein